LSLLKPYTQTKQYRRSFSKTETHRGRRCLFYQHIGFWRRISSICCKVPQGQDAWLHLAQASLCFRACYVKSQALSESWAGRQDLVMRTRSMERPAHTCMCGSIEVTTETERAEHGGRCDTCLTASLVQPGGHDAVVPAFI
jgi:hypothetical protein